MKHLRLFYLLGIFLLLPLFSQSQNSKSTGDEVLIQGFNWLSWMMDDGWYNFVETKAIDLGESQIDAIWLPPPSKSNALAAQGYLPTELNDLDSEYGLRTELETLISSLHDNNVKAIADIVINHRVGTTDWADFTNPDWGCWAVCADDEWGQNGGNPCGGYDTGAGYSAGRDIDHNNTTVRDDIKAWMSMLKNDVGFDGWRYDYVKGFSGSYIQEYNDYTNPWFVVGECWEDYNTIINWLNSSGADTKAFDFGLKGSLHSAFNDNNLSYLNAYGNMPSITGTHPGRSVTFLENHDSGFPQNHWPFPSDHVLEGYAYILTHPGTPMIFWNHYYEWGIHDDIKAMIQIRKANGINSTSTLNIQKSDWDCYAAIIDDKVAMKIGSGDWSPTGAEWILSAYGTNYAIWSKTSLDAPTVTIDPAEGHYDDPITVTITATDNDDPNPTIYYTTDGTEPNTGSTSGTSPITFDISDNTVVKAMAIDASTNESSIITKTYTIGEIPGFIIHAKNKTGWGTPYIFYWDVDPAEAMLAATWPGVEMYPEGDGWYYYEFPNVLSTNIIFSNNGSDQTADILGITSEGWYDLNTDTWVSQPDLAPMLTFSPEGGAFSEPINVTITATDDSDPNPVFYYTTDGTTPTLASSSATNFVTLNISENTTIKAFSTDISGNTSDIYTQEYQFVEGGFTVHFKNSPGWEQVKIYYWDTDPTSIIPATDWPGEDMIPEGNNWYYFDFIGVNSTNIIFNNGFSGDGNQTEDIFTETDLWYDGGLLNAPEASNVQISGDLMYGALLSGSYTYFHPDGVTEASSVFKWYRATDASGTAQEKILTAVDDSYTLTNDDIDKFIMFSVTPVDENGISGEEVFSDYIGPVLSTYSLTITVNDGTDIIEGAQVDINSEILTTNSNGKVYISLVNGDYPFTVNYAGYDEYSGSVTISNSNKNITVSLDESSYTATFSVTDGTIPLQNAQININSQTLQTDAAGVANISLLDGTYPYTVSKAGYNSESGNIVVSGANLTENVVLTQATDVFTVSFNVTYNSNPFQGAEITIAGETLTTDGSGIATIDLANGTYSYSCLATGYGEIDGSVTVDNAPLTENIVLEDVYELTFNVTDGTNPIVAAQISINSEILTTDASGVATISLVNGTYPYSVNATGYQENTGSVTIAGTSQEITVTLTEIESTATITFIVNDSQNQTYSGFELKGSWNPDGEYDDTWNYGNIHSIFYDDGTHGDITSGDNIWTVQMELIPDGGANTWMWGVNDQDGTWIDGNFEFTVVDASEQTLIYDLTEGDTYTVTFNVTDGSNPVQDASVTISGQVLNTNVNGDAFISLVDGTYPYTASKNGYQQSTGNITVAGSNLTENVVITPATTEYSITFNVTDGVNPIVGASITVSGQTLTTNASGEATIDLLDGTYAYTVTKAGYNQSLGNVTVSGNDVTENVVLDEIVLEYIVTFIVTDGTNPIENASIFVDDQTISTDVNGEATISLPDGDYDYSVSKISYEQFSGSITVAGNDISEEVVLTQASDLYSVTFIVSDGTSQIGGAAISIAGETFVTSGSGMSIVQLADGEYPYTVNADNYAEATGLVIVNGENQTEYVTLTATAFNVIFNIDMANMTDPFDEVYISGDILNPVWPEPGTNSAAQMFDDNTDNIYSISFMLEPGTYEYKYFVIQSGVPSWDVGFPVDNLSFSVVDAEVVLDDVWEMLSISENLNDQFVVYPNPSNGLYWLVYNSDYELQITDLTGKIILNKTVNQNQVSVNISDMSAGIYIFKIMTKEGVIVKKVLKY